MVGLDLEDSCGGDEVRSKHCVLMQEKANVRLRGLLVATVHSLVHLSCVRDYGRRPRTRCGDLHERRM